RHKEQRKSATYFAVTKCSIPAFGIEASKSLPLFQKVKHHQYAINAFFDEFGIIPELPALTLEKPELRYLVLSINGNTPIVLNKEETVYVKKGSMIKIVHAEANYSRGITVDVVDCGGKNDIGNEITIEKNTRIAAKKDYEPCGSVYVKVTDNKSDDYFSVAEKKIRENHFYFQVRINGNRLVNIKNNGVLKVSAGDFIELIDVDSGMHDPGLLEVNIKGYVNDSMNNTGEDRGCVVDTSTDFWEKYSTKGNGLNYPVVASYNGYPVASMIIRLEGETEKILILESQKGDLFCVSNKNDFHVDKADFFIDSVSGVFQSDLDSGFYYLEANGKKIADLKSKPALSNFYVSGDKKIAISLFAELKGKKRKKCDFIIKIKEK
ncbi:MAG: hypothetical protein H6681_05445, partial [Desulfobacteraceae bacterium]|nr:hypothetical protein [Desulfobacteraceae bacterium]